MAFQSWKWPKKRLRTAALNECLCTYINTQSIKLQPQIGVIIHCTLRTKYYLYTVARNGQILEVGIWV